jgi:hypothetical protein
LFDGGGQSSAAANAPAKPEAEKPLNPNDPNAWVLAEGVMGNGPAPEWFLKDKYPNVAEQAKAYVEAQKRFGSFVGAPKDGKYETPPMPEGLQGEFLTDHPVFSKFTQWAAKSQLSQAGYNEVLGMLAEYEAAQAPDISAIKQSLGRDADARISAVSSWANANLTQDQVQVLRDLGTTAQAGQVLQLMEAVIAKARATATPPKVTDTGTVAPAATGLALIRAEHAKRGPDGKLLFDTDPKHRANVEKAYSEYFARAQQ